MNKKNNRLNKNNKFSNNDNNKKNYINKFKSTAKVKRTNSKRYDIINIGDIRLNKYISDSGMCSRREADNYINRGKVRVNGKKVGIGSKINSRCDVVVNDRLITRKTNSVYICLNKPIGITCTTELNVKDNIIDFIHYPDRIFPIGRLDKDSEGLILLTNDGDIVNKVLRAGNKHEKEYVVRVDKQIKSDFIDKMSNGISILKTTTKNCKVTKIDEYTFNIILIQGLNRQIRRMCESLGYNVVGLKRTRIMNIYLNKLPLGEWRNLTEEELKFIKE